MTQDGNQPTPDGVPRGAVRPGSAALGLLAIFVIALTLRLAAVWLVHPTPLAGDEREYWLRAAHQVEGRLDPSGGGRAPAMDYYWAAALGSFGRSVDTARSANAVVGALVVLPMFALGAALGGRRCGLVAAAITAVYPNLLAFSHYLWAETFFIAVLTTTVAALVSFDARAAAWKPIAAGVGFGIAILIREAGLLLPVLAASWLVWRGRPREGLTPAVGLLAAAAAVVLPWTWQLNRADAPFALVTRSSYQNLYIGNAPPAQGPDGAAVDPRDHYWTLGEDRYEREVAARMLALDAIGARLPWWPLEKVIEQLPRFLSPTSFAVRRLQMDPREAGLDRSERVWAYRFRVDVPRGARAVAVGGVVVAYVTVLLAGVAGLVLAPRRGIAVLFAAMALGLLVPTLVTFAASRFRLPVMPFLIAGAALLAVDGRALWGAASVERRRVALVGVVAVALIVASRWRDPLTAAWG